MQGGVGLQLSTAADGLPLPTCVVAFDQEPASGAQQPVQPVRLVIISDTHGFEQSMTNRSAMAQQSMANSKPAAAAAADDDDEDEDDPDDPAAAAAAAAAAPAAPWATAALPEGDVLIHCGDFAPGPIWPNGESVRPDEAQVRFDSWLAVQPHPLKVVVRGNHDPRHALFPRSGAVYATSPRALELEVRGRPLRLALVPFERRPRGKNAGARKRRAKAGLGGAFSLPAGEVLISHVPPRGVLDRCSSGDLGGCSVLRALVERAEEKPRLWLCGHIHEGRGAVRHRFEPPGAYAPPAREQTIGDSEGAVGAAAVEPGYIEPGTTVVVNAASANSGMARQLLHGATVVDVMV